MFMKLGGIGLLAGFLLVMGATNAQAVTINSGAGVPWSQSVGTGCGAATGSSVVITPEILWVAAPAGSAWISCADNLTGAGGGANLSTGAVVSFDQSFVLPGGPFPDGTLSVAADDTTGVTLNGNLLMAAGTTTGLRCSNNGISCDSLTTLVLPMGDMSTGTNNLVFDMHELDGNGSGLVYSGSVNVVPEPTSLALMASGVLGLVRIRLGARKAQV
jgi:hypothetical protein